MEPTEKAIKHGLALLTSSLRQEVDSFQVRAYLRALKDVRADVVLEAVDVLVQQLASQPAGKRYFPTVPDWLAACVSVVEGRRKRVAQLAQALREDCPECHGAGFRDAEGPNQVERCSCVKRAAQLMAEVPDRMHVALPASTEPEPAA